MRTHGWQGGKRIECMAANGVSIVVPLRFFLCCPRISTHWFFIHSFLNSQQQRRRKKAKLNGIQQNRLLSRSTAPHLFYHTPETWHITLCIIKCNFRAFRLRCRKTKVIGNDAKKNNHRELSIDISCSFVS